uniref:Uncharacterized protein n=1 Tax=Anguilla anguilla TaxID=7936 RepID=A0A0E9TX22_ANGAN
MDEFCNVEFFKCTSGLMEIKSL